MIEQGVDVMLVQSDIGYKRPARADEEIDVRVRVARIGTTSMELGVSVEREGDVLVEASLHYVFVDATALTKTPIPEGIRSALSSV